MTDSPFEQTIAVVGLGKLGLPIALTWASRGCSVRGYDSNPGRRAAILAGGALEEEGLQDLWGKAQDHFQPAENLDHALERAGTVFVYVPTPSREDGSYDISRVQQAVREIGERLRSRRPPCVVAVGSTVSPGDLDGSIQNDLVEAIGAPASRLVSLCYTPAFVAQGSVSKDFLNPDLVLIGAEDFSAAERLESLYRMLLGPDAPIVRMNRINAELAKLALNTFVTTRISFANLIARLCERLPGADAGEVTRAIGRDRRIGSHSLRGGLPYGGPCFPRDNAALANLAHRLDVSPLLPEATDRFNRDQIPVLARSIASATPKGGTVAILGTAYKAGTAVIDESPGIALCHELVRMGFSVVVHDPRALSETRRRLENRVEYADSLKDAVDRGQTVVVTAAWPEYRRLPFGSERRGVVLFDFWNGVEADSVPSGIRRILPGKGASL